MKLAKSMKKEVLDLVFEDAKRMSEETRSVVETHIKLKNTISPQPWVSSDGILVTTPEGQQIYTYEEALQLANRTDLWIRRYANEAVAMQMGRNYTIETLQTGHFEALL